MSTTYRAVDWNRNKRAYDAALAALAASAMAAFAGATLWRSPATTAETLLLRTTAFGAIALLHGILAIGPLARLDPRFLPWLYNRRHAGVLMCGLAAVHGTLATVQFHAFGDANPIVSMLAGYGPGPRGGWAQAPFEPFGAAALSVLVAMAATSHDFWLRNLGAGAWKALHCGVYVAYGCLLAHVGLGFLQSERSPVPAAFLFAGAAGLAALHLAAAGRRTTQPEGRAPRVREAMGTSNGHAELVPPVANGRPNGLVELVPPDAREKASGLAELAPVAGEGEGWIDAGDASGFAEGRGRVVVAAGRTVAVFRVGERLFATGNACRHQGGPLGEGRIVDGCITCPWHGWNYRPEDGCSPPPFQERIETYPTRVESGRLWIRVGVAPARPATRCLVTWACRGGRR